MSNSISTVFSSQNDVLSSIFSFVGSPSAIARVNKKCQEASKNIYISLYNEYQKSDLLKPCIERALIWRNVTINAEGTKKIVKFIYKTIIKHADCLGKDRNQILKNSLTLGTSNLGASRLEAIVEEINTNQLNRFLKNTGLQLENECKKTFVKDSATILKSLDGDNNNTMITLPPEIAQLDHLKIMIIACHTIYRLPAEISKLINLTFLDLHSNRIEWVPPEIGKLNKLICLNLSNNQLYHLPSEMDQLKALEKLYLGFNYIKELPCEIGKLTQLKALVLEKNRIEDFPLPIIDLVNLEELIMNQCKLRNVPKEIKNLNQLKKLDLTANQITDLPPEFGELTNLVELYIRNNPMDRLSFSTKRKLVNLKTLEETSSLITKVAYRVYLFLFSK